MKNVLKADSHCLDTIIYFEDLSVQCHNVILTRTYDNFPFNSRFKVLTCNLCCDTLVNCTQ